MYKQEAASKPLLHQRIHIGTDVETRVVVKGLLHSFLDCLVHHLPASLDMYSLERSFYTLMFQYFFIIGTEVKAFSSSPTFATVQAQVKSRAPTGQASHTSPFLLEP